MTLITAMKRDCLWILVLEKRDVIKYVISLSIIAYTMINVNV